MVKDFMVGDCAVINPHLKNFPVGTCVTVVGHTEVWGIDSMIPNLLVKKDGCDRVFNINKDNLIPHELWGTRFKFVEHSA